MENKTKHTNGKGDKSRIGNKKKFDENWERIFGKKGDKNENKGRKRIKVTD